MTTSPRSEPWRALPAGVADVIEPELAASSDEILATIAREVPEYARPLEGSFGRGVRTGVTQALAQFVELIRNPAPDRSPGREVYIALGRGELRQGRTLDALQSAYRVGARVAWRRVAAAARRAELDPEVLSLLAESIFAYIDELSADSVEGYTEAQSELESERQRRRRELVILLLRDPPADDADVRAAAGAAAWTVPRSTAALACAEADLGRLGSRLPLDTLTTGIDGTGCAVIADPEGPGRGAQIAGAVEGVAAVLGPVGTPAKIAGSWSLARATFRALQAKAISGDGLIRAGEHLVELLVYENRGLVERLAAGRLAPFDGLTPKARERMTDTALAYLQQQGNAAAMARALRLHPQTARYRLARLRELLGDQLDDPDARFELELALRARMTP